MWPLYLREKESKNLHLNLNSPSKQITYSVVRLDRFFNSKGNGPARLLSLRVLSSGTRKTQTSSSVNDNVTDEILG